MNVIDLLFNREQLPSTLHTRYASLKAGQTLRRREMAEALQVSEAQLIDLQCDVKSIRLNREFGRLIQQLPSLGYIMTLTRNEYAVHERKGCYDNITVNDAMALAIASDRKIDLRIILHRWRHGFAVREDTDNGLRYSLQFFDQGGAAIQKIYLQPESDQMAYAMLVQNFYAKDQQSALNFPPVIDTPDYVNDAQVDTGKLAREWSEMTDVHQFFSMLRRHNVSREQAFRLIGDRYARPFEPALMERVLSQAAELQIPIMCFVGNAGNIQIHSGVVNTIKRMGPWLNILDPEFNLHLREDGIANAWLVRKPTVDGLVTSLELYDRQSTLVTQFFGVRAERQPENPRWRNLAESVLGDRQRAA